MKKFLAMKNIVLIVVSLLSVAANCDGAPVKTDFGKTADGTPVELYTLTNDAGRMSVKIMTLGATVVELTLPNKTGNSENIVLGFDSVAGYESKDNQYFGCTVGRVANRIAKGRFSIYGNLYKLNSSPGRRQ